MTTGDPTTATTDERERLVGGETGRLLASLSLAWATLQLGRFLLSSTLPAIVDATTLTPATAGLTLGGFQLLYAVTQYPAGRVSDGFGRPAMVVGGLAVIVASFAAFAAARTAVAFAVAALALGLGKGLFAVPSRAQLSDAFVRRRGQALGVYAAGTDVGGFLASVVGVVVTSGVLLGVTLVPGGTSWRAPFVPLAVSSALVGVAYVAWNDEPYRVGRPAVALLDTLRRLATTRRRREALIAFSAFFFVVGAWVSFLPEYLTRTKGFSEATAAGVFAVVFVVGFAVKPVAGSLADRFPRRAVAAGGLLVAVASLGGVVLANALWAVVAAVAVYALGYKSVFPVVDASLLDAAPDANAGGDLGAARALFLGVGALGPVYLGWAAETVGYRAGFVGLGAALLAAVLLLARGIE